MRKRLMNWFWLIPTVYAGFVVTLFLTQRRLLYHPSVYPIEPMQKLAEDRSFGPWRNSSGEFIGWKRVGASPTRDRILIFHGNAGCAVDRTGYLDGLIQVRPFDIYILEYPGYGARPGAPSQDSILGAATEGIDLIGGQVFLMGESLGTGVAAFVAGIRPQSVAGLILIAPYQNLADVGQHHMPVFPVRWMLRDKFPAADYLRNYHGPLGVLLAEQDTIIPARFGRTLYESYQGPKKRWEIPGADHNDIPIQPAAWWREVTDFWSQSGRSE